MPATTARSPSDPLDGYCMLTAVVDGSSEHRLSTAVRGDIPSTMHELAMSIAAVHRYACASSVQTRGSCSIKRQSVATAHRRVRLWCQEARRALSCDDNDRYRSTLATSCSCETVPALGPMMRSFAAPGAYIQRYSNTRFSKALLSA